MVRPLVPGGVYPILDESVRPTQSRGILAAELAAAGARMIQLRAKTLPAKAAFVQAVEMRDALEHTGCLLIINDRADIASSVYAAGVHVGQDDLPPEKARVVVGYSALVGFSTHDMEQALNAQKRGVDYIGFGPLYGTTTKPDALSPRGTTMLANIVAAAAPLPVFAIGGITHDTIGEIAATGATGAAVISALNRGESIGAAYRELAETWCAAHARASA